jgi:two-component sensor histidine kinase
MFGVNEIMREAVSNAVRHGGATNVEIEIDREGDEVIDFVAKNNGQPVNDNFEKGIGSEMLDELTLDWKLKEDKLRGKVLLTASIPVLL